MPAFPNLQGEAIQALARFSSMARTCRRASRTLSPINLAYRFTGYRRWLDPEGYPAVAHALGNPERHRPGHRKIRLAHSVRRVSRAGGARARTTPAAKTTAARWSRRGGLLFIGATIHDRKFRAFDKRSGKLLWEYALPYLRRRHADHLPGGRTTVRGDLRQRRQGARRIRRRRVPGVRAAGRNEPVSRPGSGARHELQRHRIHAVAQSGRIRSVVEHVPEMRIAAPARNRRAHPSSGWIGESPGHWSSRSASRSSASRYRIRTCASRIEQRRVTADAAIQAVGMIVVVLAGERRARCPRGASPRRNPRAATCATPPRS